MTPLRITAHLDGALVTTNDAYRMDSLLDWASYPERGAEHPKSTEEWETTHEEIPIQRSACGRFHMVSDGVYDVEVTANRWTNRRFPMLEAQMFGDEKLRRIDVKAGAQKSFRLPCETVHLVGDQITWVAIGDAEKIRSLLRWVSYLGKRRAVGNGRVASWVVEPTESWGDGFPVLCAGAPTRALPLDVPGIRGGGTRFGRHTFPYHYRWLEEAIACP